MNRNCFYPRARQGGLALLAGLLMLTGLLACGGNKLRANLSNEERLAHALELFRKKNYFDARTHFRIVVLNAPGSSFVDVAQYYLAECHYGMEEFITAAAEYEKLLRLYPQSEYLDDAQYKLGMCYFQLSPKADLDQKYTWQAIEQFQRFLDDYPDSELRQEVVHKLNLTREKLAQKEYRTADLYRRTGSHESALIYYDSVLNHYYDTRYYEPALYHKAETLAKLQRYSEARESLQTLIDKYRLDQEKAQAASAAPPEQKYRQRAEALLKSLEGKLAANGQAKK
ncbi:MAG: outer membrane protein assembly factor BamD [candidate division KSB1 bacterium]|nr:outer membrane protein assembly factor BamD [candidate division KSB1 bacterium]MDZ7275460.1 outer membrane protein assembly factor BamD [candidate division KSB1 bacterium]MDZ7286228.1 outer membrane protein assembly factor BamD [candidate division KSB1 bacterium]MDZ7296454.1 outer membrane protein assembly factor BamD [candidate division KSB1 bacterium]MDZ7307250.1 outer membrane protein assembly factor BamD [candidate division KSB1 bacterium]